MPLIATNKGGSNFPLAPAGLQLARIYGIIDLGTHKNVFQGVDKGDVRKVRVLFELPSHKHVFVEEKGPEPFTLSIKYTLSTHEKSTLRKHMKGWKGRDMTDEEQAAFDIEVLLGKTCMINISHKQKKDKTGDRAEIESIAQIPAEMKAQMGAAINKPILYNTAQGRDATFNLLPKWIQEDIVQSHEFTRTAPGANADSTPQEDSSEPF